MRTKTLLLTAALTAAGAATSMAQVYSVNIVGYINQSIGVGLTMLGNQLSASPDNLVTTLFPNPPNNTAISKFNGSGYDTITHVDGMWEGDPAGLTMTLNPALGEGAFITTDFAFNQTYVGEVVLTTSITIPIGLSMYASALPQSLPLTGTPPAGLNFPIGNGDVVSLFNPATQAYNNQSYVDGAWEGDLGEGIVPQPAISEAFFFFRHPDNGSTNWNRTFTVGP